MNGIKDFELSRKALEQVANYIYYALSVGNGIIMFSLVWRIDNLVMRAWAFLAALAIIGSSIIWLKATQYSFQGNQLRVARIFLALDWIIAVANIIALFYAELAPEEAATAAYGVIHFWSIAGSAIGVMSALVGIGFLQMFSPDRLETDVARQYKHGIFELLQNAMKTGDLPPDIKAQQLRDAHDMLHNIALGIGGNSVNGANISPDGVGTKRASIWDNLGNLIHTNQAERNATPPTQVTQPEPAAVPIMIPSAIRARLSALGYSQAEIDAMRPPQARAILSEWETPIPQNGAQHPNS